MAKRKDSKNRVLKEGEYERSNGTYEFKWRNKVHRRFSIYAETLEELRSKELDILRDSLDGIDTSAKDMTVNDVYKKWVTLKKGLKDNTFQNYKYMFEMFAVPALGAFKIQVLKKSDIRAFYNELHDNKGLKPASIDCIHTVLHQVLQIAVDDEYLRSNPADSALKELLVAYSSEAGKRTALTVEQETILLKFLSTSTKYRHWYPTVMTLLGTGLRIGELAGLRWCDIDLDKGMIHVTHTLVFYAKKSANKEFRKCTYAVNTPKTPAGYRDVPMLPEVKEAIFMEKQFLEEAGINCKANIDGYTDFIFLNRFGYPLHQGIVNKALRRIIRDCNFEILDNCKKGKVPCTLPQFSCHVLRHTFATRMNENNINGNVRMAVLGHTSLEITDKVYTDTFDGFKQAEFNKLKPQLEKLMQ